MSQPYPDWTTPNLVHLNSKQALADLADFRMFVSNTYKVPTTSKYISIGGSYPGALSAWFRLKFPHLVDGAWSSSGVVDAVYDFTMFDTQIGISAGPECAAALRNATLGIDARLNGGADSNFAVKRLFAADPADFPATPGGDGDFRFLMADSGALGFQYGQPSAVCGPMVAAARAGKDLVAAFADYTKSFFLPSFCGGVGARSYASTLQRVLSPMLFVVS